MKPSHTQSESPVPNATKLRHLREPDTVTPANMNVHANSDVPASSAGAKVFVSRRRTEHTTQKSPLKLLQGYISKAIKRKPQAETSELKTGVAETPEPVAFSPATPPEQLCARLDEPLEEKKAPADEKTSSAPTDTNSSSTPSEAVESSASSREQQDNGAAVANGHANTSRCTGNWHGETKGCSIVFLPSEYRPMPGVQQLQNSPSTFRKDQWEPMADEDYAECIPVKDARNPAERTFSSSCREKPDAQPTQDVANSVPMEVNPGGSTGWMNCQRFVQAALIAPWQAGVEKLSLLRMAFSEGARQNSPEEGQAAAALTASEANQPQAQLQGFREQETGGTEAMPLTVLTPRASDAATLPLREVARLEQPPADAPDFPGFRGGFAASLSIITNILEKVVAALEGSSVVLSACSPSGGIDECQIVLDISSADASPGREVALQEGEQKTAETAASLENAKLQTQVEGHPQREAEEQTRLAEPPREHKAQESYRLDRHAANTEEHPEIYDTTEASRDDAQGVANAAVTAAGSEFHSLISRTPAPLTRVSSVDDYLLNGSQKEEPHQPALPAAAAMPRDLSLRESSQGSVETESQNEVTASATFLQVAECTTMPAVAHEETSYMGWVRPYHCSHAENPLLPTRPDGFTENNQSDSPVLPAAVGDQKLQGGTCSAGSPLRGRLKAAQASELDVEDAEHLPTGDGSPRDGCWTFLGSHNDTIPAVHVPSGDAELPCSPHYLRGPIKPHDAAAFHLVGRSDDCCPGLVETPPSHPHTGTPREQDESKPSQRPASLGTLMTLLPPISEGSEGEYGEQRRCSGATAGREAAESQTECDADAEHWWQRDDSKAFSGVVVSRAQPENDLGSCAPIDPVEQRMNWVCSEEEALDDFSVCEGSADTEEC